MKGAFTGLLIFYGAIAVCLTQTYERCVFII